jgi:hypothetical protein
MRSPNLLPPRSTSPASVTSTPPGSPALAGTADALQGPHAGAGPSTAPRVGQRRSAQQAGLEGPPVRQAPALRQPAQAQLRGAGFGPVPARPALLSPQEMAGLHALVGTTDAHEHHRQVPPQLPSMHELLPQLAGLLDSPTPHDGVPMNPEPHGHAHPAAYADSAASSSLPLGPSNSDGSLPPLEELMSAPRPTTTLSAPRGGMSKVAKPHLLMSPTEPGHVLRHRPASQELLNTLHVQIAAKNSEYQRSNEGRALSRVQQSLQEALQDPQRRQALQRQGISLHAHGVDTQGQPVSRQRQLTPLLEQTAHQALVHLQGLSDADMTRLDRAFFMANMIREQLGQEKAAGAEQRILAQAAGATVREKEMSKLEGGQLMRLAVAYAGKALGLDPASTLRLQQRLTNSSTSGSREFQQKLRDLSGRQGPLALALVHKVYDHEWVTNEKVGEDGVKARNVVLAKHRAAFVEALTRVKPDSMDRLIAAAHDPDPSAMARVCAGIETEMAADPTFGNRNRNQKSFLSNALMRLQGQNPTTAGYAGAPPADQALRWLQSKAPSATLE